MNLLLIDAGNTSVKYRLCQADGQILKSFRWTPQANDARTVAGEILKLEAHSIWISDVRNGDFPMPASGKKNYINMDVSFPFDFRKGKGIALGSDRLCMAAGALFDFSEADALLVVGMGTAITYNLITGKQFKGGAISPGMELRFRALHAFTGNLPLTHYSPEVNFPAVVTEDAIQSGVIQGLIYEINGFRELANQSLDKEVLLILSGGDATSFENRLKSPYFVVPDLVLNGLYQLALLNGNV